MRVVLCFLILLLVVSNLHAQPPTTQANNTSLTITDTTAIVRLRNATEQLRLQLAQLESNQRINNERAAKTQRDLYYDNRAKTEAMLQTLLAVRACNGILQQAVQVAETQSVLAAVNNPQSGALGFRFTDVVRSSLEAQLKKNALGREDKNNLLASVGNIINTVGKLLNPSSLVVQTVQTIAGLLPGRVRGAVNDPTGEIFTSDFMDTMRPYLEYYDKVQAQNEEHRAGLDRLRSKYSSLTYNLRDLTTEAATHQVNVDQSVAQIITKIFGDPSQPVDYEAVNSNPDVRYLGDISADVYMLTKEVLEFHREYDATMRSHFTKSRELLDVAKAKWPANSQQIEVTKSQIVISDNLTGFSELLNIITVNARYLRTYRGLAIAPVPAPSPTPTPVNNGNKSKGRH